MTNTHRKSTYYAVVLLPEKALYNRSIHLNQHLYPLGLEFNFGEESTPHLSLYMLRIRNENLENIARVLKIVAEKNKPCFLKSQEYRLRNRYLAVNYERTATIYNLQYDVVIAANLYRDGVHSESVKTMETSTGIALRNFKKYGWGSIGTLYDPHLTLARFIDPSQTTPADLGDYNNFSGWFDELAIFKMGDNGTARYLVASFKLSK